MEQNQEVVHTLRETYLDLGGDEDNVRVWLQKLLVQNPYVLLRPAQAWRDGVGFLRGQGFSTEELLGLLSDLGASVAELQPAAMQLALAYVQETLRCSTEELTRLVLHCPALLYYSLPTKKDFEGPRRTLRGAAGRSSTPSLGSDAALPDNHKTFIQHQLRAIKLLKYFHL